MKYLKEINEKLRGKELEVGWKKRGKRREPIIQ